MQGKQSNDLAVLDKALRQTADGLDFIPTDIESDLKEKTVEELHDLLRKGCTVASLIMAQKGWVLMMLKRKVHDDGRNFKDHLCEIEFDYTYANKCMKVARAISCHPELAKIPDTHLLRRIIYLPEVNQAEIAVKLSHVSRATKRKEEYNHLRPWILEQIADGMRKEEAKTRRAPKKKAPEPLPERNMDAAWINVRDHWADALAALGHLVAAAESVKMKREYFDEVFDHPNGHWCTQLGKQLDRLVEILSPYDEIKRRGLSEE